MIDLKDIQNVVKQIVDKFHPEKVILFGSYAYGRPTEDSDVDLLVLMPFQGRRLEQALKIRAAVDYDFPMDLLIKTPEDAQDLFLQHDPFIRAAMSQGKVLYDRHY